MSDIVEFAKHMHDELGRLAEKTGPDTQWCVGRDRTAFWIDSITTGVKAGYLGIEPYALICAEHELITQIAMDKGWTKDVPLSEFISKLTPLFNSKVSNPGGAFYMVNSNGDVVPRPW